MLIDIKKDENWLELVLLNLQYVGFCALTGVVDTLCLKETQQRMYQIKEKIIRDIGKEKLDRAGEMGVLRLMVQYDPYFLRFLEIPEILSIIDNTVSETAILHLQNGFINSPVTTDVTNIFQYKFHRDFPRLFNGFLASINIFVAVTEFTHENGATLVIPGSHQKNITPSEDYKAKSALPIECPAGSLIIFDSTLWHAAGKNISSTDRLGINLQFTRSYLKQQIDYVRALSESAILEQKPRTQQLLGYYTRVVTSLNEFYLPESERLYRRGQG